MNLNDLLQQAHQNLPLLRDQPQDGNLSPFTSAPPEPAQPTYTPPTAPPSLSQQAVGMQGTAQADVQPSPFDNFRDRAGDALKTYLGGYTSANRPGAQPPPIQTGTVDPSIGPIINGGQGGFGSPGADVAAAVMDNVARIRGIDPHGSYGGPGIKAGGNRVIALAKTQLGVPYDMGAYDPAGGGSANIDCSGLTKWVFSRLGVDLPHSAAQQSQMFPKIGREQMQPGDLVFYDYGRLGGASDHVAIYAGNGRQIAASSSAGQVTVQPVDWSHFIWGGNTPLSGGQGGGGGGQRSGGRPKTAPASPRRATPGSHQQL